MTRPLGRVEEIADARDAEHVGDLVRIADRRGDAVRRTQRSNSSGVTSEDSIWRCVSMKPGTATAAAVDPAAPR